MSTVLRFTKEPPRPIAETQGLAIANSAPAKSSGPGAAVFMQTFNASSAHRRRRGLNPRCIP